MNIFKKAWARTFEGVMRLALPLLPYRDPKIVDDLCEVPEVLRANGKTRALIVADPGVLQMGLCAPLLDAFEKAQAEYRLFSDVVPNPTTTECEAALSCYKENGCDCLVAVGGGSALDCAKAVGARLARPKKSLAKMAGILKVRKRIPLLIAVPTTAGTGSETTLAAVITDAQTRHKYAINDFPLIPRYAVLDAQLLRTLPPALLATTGMDALTHALEAYIGRSTNKATRTDAENAVRLIFENLPVAYRLQQAAAKGDAPDGQSEQALKNMLLASHYAGRAFSKSYVGYVHALAHALGGKYNTPHGLANAVLLRPVLRAYGSKIHKKLRKLAVLCGFAAPDATAQQAAEAFMRQLDNLENTLNIPATIAAVRAQDHAMLAEHAYREAYPLYPVPVLWDRKQLIRIYAEVTE